MPRGKASFQIVGASSFSKDETITYEGLVFKMSKSMSKENEQLTYIMNEDDVKKRLNKPSLFPTFFFDDRLKVEVFQKNSSLKNNQIGKGWVDLREIAFLEANSASNQGTTIIGLPISTKKDSIT
jgi:hypothetical protein